MTGVSLCSGYGGLDLVAQAIFGGDVVVHGETYAPAHRVLAAHWPGVPNVRDITAADWSPWAGQIDWLTAGWPCQPWSTAGRRKGAKDDRAIWPAVARAVRDLRPRVVLLENVANIAPTGELARAVGDLATVGYVGSWRCVRASDAGAPHQRKRIFILAVDADATGSGSGLADDVRRDGCEAIRSGQAEPRRRDRAPADADGSGFGAGEPNNGPWQPDADRCTAPDATGVGCRHGGAPSGQRVWTAIVAAGDRIGGRQAVATEDAVDWAAYGPAIRRWEAILGRPAPEPVVMGRRGGRQLSPLFVEWMQGLPEGWVTGVDGLSRNAMLHLLGNGVVPQQAVLAVREMLPDVTGLERAS